MSSQHNSPLLRFRPKVSTPRLNRLRNKLNESLDRKETIDMYDDQSDEVQSYASEPVLSETELAELLEDAKRQEEAEMRRLDEEEAVKRSAEGYEPPEDEDEEEELDILWELPHKTLRKGDTLNEVISLERPGRYQLVVNKVDRSITRTVAIDMKVYQGEKVALQCTGSVGLASGSQHCMDLKLSRPSELHVTFRCVSSLLGAVQIKAALYAGCMVSPDAKEKEEKEQEEKDEVKEETEEKEAPVEGSVVAELKSRQVSGTSAKELTATLEAGWYSIGVKNDDSRLGVDYRKLEGDVTICCQGKDITSSVRHTQDESETDEDEEAPVQKKVFGFTNLRNGHLPWRAQFCILPEQAPATFSLKVSKMSYPSFASRVSAKLRTVPDPHSMEEILKRTKSIQMKIFGFVALLLFLSYGSQIVSTIFAMQIPLVQITVRGILTVMAIAYGYVHREEIRQMMKNSGESVQNRLAFFKKLDELEGLDKIRYLQERSKIKKQMRQEARKSMMIL